MTEDKKLEQIFESRHMVAKVRGICDLDPVPVPDLPLGKAIILVAQGVDGQITTAARIFWGADGSINYDGCKIMLQRYGEQRLQE
ncbi:hypothetical protein ACIPSK_25145 [Rhizobium sp. LARHSG275]|uniref:hypothetical protein n=1 Tax=Rhizobium TaxID=379 RepID=UPI0013899640|nr:hypothetical protein [Rhizobium laguerreae]NDK50231.1 hypothetical protein [Rhizobium laguerreae]